MTALISFILAFTLTVSGSVAYMDVKLQDRILVTVEKGDVPLVSLAINRSVMNFSQKYQGIYEFL